MKPHRSLPVDQLSGESSASPSEDLLQLTLELAGSLDARTVMGRILERSLAVASADRATLSSFSSDEFVIEASVGSEGQITWVGQGYEAGSLMRQPLVVEMLATRRPVLGGRMDTGEALPEFRSALARVRHTAVVPILEAGTLVAMLVLSRYQPRPFEEAEIPSLTAFAALAGLALRNAKLYEEARAATCRLEAAAEAATEVAAHQDLPALLERVIEHACISAGADSAAVMRLEGDVGVVEATSGVAPIGSRWPLPPSILAAVAEGQAIQLPAARADVEMELEPYASPYSHALVSSMRFSGEVLGLLVLGRLRGRPPFSKDDIAGLQQFATLAALVLHNGRLVHRLRGSETMKREFINIVVHELRGPLTVIEGYAELLMSGEAGTVDGEAERRLAIIRRQAGHALSLAEDLLILARLESDQLGVAYQVIGLGDTVGAATERALPRARLRGGTIDVEVVDDVRAVADAALVARVLDILLTNAIVYSIEPPRVTVIVTGDAAGASVSVQDNGPGVRDDERELIFARFARGSDAVAVPGTGLGLYLSRECARRMDGDLVLEESTSGGSRFLLTLPTASPAAAQPARVKRPRRIHRRAASATAPTGAISQAAGLSGTAPTDPVGR